MERIKFTLCPNCTECPEVEITEQGVSIGEHTNIVRLSHAEWNELVRLVRSGKLREVLTIPGSLMGRGNEGQNLHRHTQGDGR
jgi:hypothetical protein